MRFSAPRCPSPHIVPRRIAHAESVCYNRGMVHIGNSWDGILAGVFASEEYAQLREFLKEEYRTRRIYPDMRDIFNALVYTPYEKVKAVILGQDPYHNEGQAHGLSFSVKPGVETPPSLVNIFKEIKDDPLWGICVVIDHGDGYETHYYGLDKSLEVKEGSNVESGQKIGVTGTIECESKLAPHLHFAVKQNGKWVSPKEYING